MKVWDIFSEIFSVNAINPFHATGLFWYPLKTSENRFQGVSKETSGMKWVKVIFQLWTVAVSE